MLPLRILIAVALLSLRLCHLASSLNQEGLYLLQAKSGLFDPDNALADWSARDPTPCNWTGVLCSSSSAVTSLKLADLNLVGPFASGNMGKDIGKSDATTSFADGAAVMVEIRNLSFTYPGIDGHPPPGSKPLIDDFSLKLHAGERCLLVGSNGAGKTTILKILGGKHMVNPDMVSVMGRSAFHDTALTSSGDLSYLGGEWRRDVTFAGFEVTIQMDISAEKMIYGVSGVDPERRDELIKVLDIDLSWRMHKSSDGQRRRLQICMGLLKPFKVLLLDEITVDLDVLVRANFLKYLKNECEVRGATIIYATHIFDGLNDWPSHIVYVAHGKLQIASPLDKVKEMSHLSLMRTVESWLRKERDEVRKVRKQRKDNGLPEYELSIDGTRVIGDSARMLNNGWAAGRLHSTVAGEEDFYFSSNRVIRQ